MSSDSPKKYNSPEVAASKQSLNAFAGYIQPAAKTNNQPDGDLSSWVCNAEGCRDCVRMSIEQMVMSSRKKKGDTSTNCPNTLLCSKHHTLHIGGTDVKLKNGQVKHRAEHQKKKAKANAVVADSNRTFFWTQAALSIGSIWMLAWVDPWSERANDACSVSNEWGHDSSATRYGRPGGYGVVPTDYSKGHTVRARANRS